MPEKVLVFGLGGIGGVYTCILALSGQCEVHVVARSNYATIKERGIKFVTPKFGNHEDVPIAGVWKSCEDAAKAGHTFSYVLCANKAVLDATPSLSDHIRAVITPSTSIVLLQNGVGAEDPLHASFPGTTIISAVVWTGGRILAETIGEKLAIEQFNREGLTIGVDYRQAKKGEKEEEYKDQIEEEDARLEVLKRCLEAGGGSVTPTKDIQSERWVKVIWNCCWNSLTALSRLRTNVFFDSSPQAIPLCYTIMEEVAAVARAKGLSIPDGTVEGLMNDIRKVDGLGLPSSMMMDHYAARPMEVEVILGTPVKEAQRLDVPVPTLLTLYVLVKALDYGNAHEDLKVDGK